MKEQKPAAAERGGAADSGLFGPNSASWRVLRESSVMVGGVRALLMHAAHPLVVAGARQTGMYEHDPWRRLERTLRLTFTVVFGTTAEAQAASRRIDDVHRGIKGIDPVTRLPYDARDPALLLWVHACLVASFLELERRTLGRLDDAGRQRFHEEQMVGVAPLGLPPEGIPPTVAALDAYLQQVIASGILRRTDSAAQVAALIRSPPRQVPRRRLWRLVSFLAFHTLPPELRDLYEVRHRWRHELALRMICGLMRLDRPLLSPRWRFIAPALAAEARLRGGPVQVSEVGLFAESPPRPEPSAPQGRGSGSSPG
ncbi:MAG TPA: oxygenase MpaB family protein [Actinomycetota bacterium]